jgi:TetR/AcrR family transcriptional repressor of nem operon
MMARPRQFDEDRVLDAVMETFWQHGYDGTSTQDLVDATGLGRGSLYAAYVNKDGLFAQALRRYQLRSRANADRLAGFASPLAGLRDLLTRTIAADDHGCLATNSAIEMAHRDPQVAALVAESFRIITAGIAAAIARGQAIGEIRTAGDPAALALFVLTTMQGLRVLARTTPPAGRPDLHKVIDQALATLT